MLAAKVLIIVLIGRIGVLKSAEPKFRQVEEVDTHATPQSLKSPSDSSEPTTRPTKWRYQVCWPWSIRAVVLPPLSCLHRRFQCMPVPTLVNPGLHKIFWPCSAGGSTLHSIVCQIAPGSVICCCPSSQPLAKEHPFRSIFWSAMANSSSIQNSSLIGILGGVSFLGPALQLQA